jgi:hypothetical protein
MLGLLFIAAGVGWSHAMMSIGQMILAGNWLLTPHLKNRLQRLIQHPLPRLHIGFFILLLIGLLWSEDLSYGWKDIRVKLPLLVLPLVFATSKKLNVKEIKGIVIIYLSSMLLLSLVSFYKYLYFLGDTLFDKRELSIKISHIRYGLNIAMAGAIAFWLFLNSKTKKGIYLILCIWFVFALYFLEAYTAIFCLSIATAVFLVWGPIFSRSIKITSVIITLIILLTGTFYMVHFYQTEYLVTDLTYDQNILLPQTINGNPYHHNPNNPLTENGVYLWRYISFEELSTEWPKRSGYSYEGVDDKDHLLKLTLIRFLNSKGYTKDSIGVHQLSEKEIQAIENGIANQYYLKGNPLKQRIHKSMFEFETYLKSGYAEGYSMIMRLIYWKTAWHIIQKNWLIGVGTGDVKQSFEKQYDSDESSLSEEYRRRAHNQYLTFWLALGIIGLLYFLFYLFLPLRLYPLHPLYFIFLGMVSISFFTEDTLETQAGATFFAFFNFIFLYLLPPPFKNSQ